MAFRGFFSRALLPGELAAGCRPENVAAVEGPRLGAPRPRPAPDVLCPPLAPSDSLTVRRRALGAFLDVPTSESAASVLPRADAHISTEVLVSARIAARRHPALGLPHGVLSSFLSVHDASGEHIRESVRENGNESFLAAWKGKANATLFQDEEAKREGEHAHGHEQGVMVNRNAAKLGKANSITERSEGAVDLAEEWADFEMWVGWNVLYMSLGVCGLYVAFALFQLSMYRVWLNQRYRIKRRWDAIQLLRGQGAAQRPTPPGDA